MNKTTIEWTDYTWNPVTGCTKVSAGCRSCYAETMNTRFGKGKKFTDVQMHEDRLLEPVEMGKKLHGKKVFVCDVSDQCNAANVPFFFKQWGEYVPHADIPNPEVCGPFVSSPPKDDEVEKWEEWLKKHTHRLTHPAQAVCKVGKSKSGNMLDGVQHLEFPIFQSSNLPI